MEEVITPVAIPAVDPPVVNPPVVADPPVVDPPVVPGSENADQAGSISLDELSKVLGKDFKDVDGALKSIQDTFSYVGSQAQYTEKIGELAETLGTDEDGVLSILDTLMDGLNKDAPPVVDATPDAQPSSEGLVTQDQYDTDTFFAAIPDMAEIRDVLGPLKEVSGADQPWAEFVKTEVAQKVIVSSTTHREVEANKSVLDPNSRIGQATDKVTDAQVKQKESQTARAQGDVTGANRLEGEAKEAAVDSVIEGFGLK